MAQSESDSAIEILVDGFLDSPFFSWVFPDDSTRAEGLDSWFRLWLDTYGDAGILIVDESGDGAALWAQPDAPPLEGDAIAALVEIVRTHNGDRTNLVLEKLMAIPTPKERHMYLNGIAARRGVRARGIGPRLLTPFLERSDTDGVPIYLESSNPRNLTFYRRYDFEDYGPPIDLPGAGPVLQPMWRSSGAGR